MKIVNIRGTSGSGKSTLVRKVMELASQRTRFMKEGRKQPNGYMLYFPGDLQPRVAIPGHYETACGGCDTINGLDNIYELVNSGVKNGMHVLFEGLIVCSDFKRLVQLKEDYGAENVLVIGLTTPIDLCLSSVQERRAARGNDAPLNPTNTIAKEKTNKRVLERFEEAGVRVEWLDREAAFARVREEFGV